MIYDLGFGIDDLGLTIDDLGFYTNKLKTLCLK